MGTFTVPARLAGKITVEALVDTGATYSKMPIDTLEQLDVQPDFAIQVELADRRRVLRQVGYVRLSLDGSSAMVPVTFGREGETPLIGATALEILGLAADPVQRRLVKSPPIEMQAVAGLTRL